VWLSLVAAAPRQRGRLDLEHAPRGEECADPREHSGAYAQSLARRGLGVAHRSFLPVAELPRASPSAMCAAPVRRESQRTAPRANSTTTVEPRLNRPTSAPRAT